MPVISEECHLDGNIMNQYIDNTNDKVYDFISEVAQRTNGTLSLAREFHALSKSEEKYSSTIIFKMINKLKRELNDTLEREKKEGKEASDKDMQMVKILEDELPDLIIKECINQRNMNNIRVGGRYRKTRKSSKSRKTRKSRKSRKSK